MPTITTTTTTIAAQQLEIYLFIAALLDMQLLRGKNRPFPTAVQSGKSGGCWFSMMQFPISLFHFLCMAMVNISANSIPTLGVSIERTKYQNTVFQFLRKGWNWNEHIQWERKFVSCVHAYVCERMSEWVSECEVCLLVRLFKWKWDYCCLDNIWTFVDFSLVLNLFPSFYPVVLFIFICFRFFLLLFFEWMFNSICFVAHITQLKK